MKIKSHSKSQRGFVSLTLVILVSTIILAFTYIRGIEIGFFFDEVQLKELRILNYQNAYKCIDQAIINFTHDFFYTMATTTEYADLHCAITMVEINANRRYIETIGNYKNILVKRRAMIRLYDNEVEVLSIE